MSCSCFANEDLLNLLITYGECQKIVSSTCRIIQERCLQRPRAAKDIVSHLMSNYRMYGRFNAVKSTNSWITGNENTQT